MSSISFTTCQAPIADPAVGDIVHYLGLRLGIDTRFVVDVAWQERERLLTSGAIDVGWICGAPYVRKIRRSDPIELLAAPVYAGPRYGQRPVYFSDVMVRRDSGFRSFADLRGARWAYNSPGSHSGYEVVRYHLARHGLNGDFFGSIIATGAHQRSMELIARGEIDASAIDTTVFDAVYERQPDLCAQLRAIEVLGPSSQPPWVIGTHVPADDRQALRAALTRMHEDDQGEAVLRRHGLARFAAVADSDYDDIRAMLALADTARVTLAMDRSRPHHPAQARIKRISHGLGK
jgi:phosphonate transport system substrate-binding protein